jgi:hypothetical protein
MKSLNIRSTGFDMSSENKETLAKMLQNHRPHGLGNQGRPSERLLEDFFLIYDCIFTIYSLWSIK